MNLNVVPAAAPAVRPQSTCAQCSRPLLAAARSHARYCGATCRKRASRRTPVNAAESVTAVNPPLPAGEAVSRFLTHPSEPQRPLRGLLAHLEGEAPAYIESCHTSRVFPRTYAEHGLPLPDYLRV